MPRLHQAPAPASWVLRCCSFIDPGLPVRRLQLHRAPRSVSRFLKLVLAFAPRLRQAPAPASRALQCLSFFVAWVPYFSSSRLVLVKLRLQLH
eukprot:8191065-Alexandrium_andersonii.AAC.1